jgi:inositol-pentakisphosphate 2-kinase
LFGQQIGRVLRIRKVSTKVSKHDSNQTCSNQEARSILSEDEKVLWREWPSLAEATTSAAMAHLYAREIVQPLLGREHVDAGVNFLNHPLSHPLLEVI